MARAGVSQSDSLCVQFVTCFVLSMFGAMAVSEQALAAKQFYHGRVRLVGNVA